MKKSINRLLAASILFGIGTTANAAPQGFEWFPRVPGPGDQLYLILNDPCHSSSPMAPVLESISANAYGADSETANIKLEYRTDLFFCNTAPPAIDAIAIPRRAGEALIDRLSSFNEQTTYENGEATGSEITRWIESLPSAVAIPPSISGTWFSPDHAEQGLLINMTAKRELLVGWTTYGADGKQRWFSGIAPTVSDESTVTLTLTDTGDGKFAGTVPNDTAASDWGTLTIEYVACGEIDIRWNPNADTGLQSGSATMQQLTQPHDAACDLASYAAALGQQLTIHSLDIETAP